MGPVPGGRPWPQAPSECQAPREAPCRLSPHLPRHRQDTRKASLRYSHTITFTASHMSQTRTCIVTDLLATSTCTYTCAHLLAHKHSPRTQMYKHMPLYTQEHAHTLAKYTLARTHMLRVTCLQTCLNIEYVFTHVLPLPPSH